MTVDGFRRLPRGGQRSKPSETQPNVNRSWVFRAQVALASLWGPPETPHARRVLEGDPRQTVGKSNRTVTPPGPDGPPVPERSRSEFRSDGAGLPWWAVRDSNPDLAGQTCSTGSGRGSPHPS